MAHTRIRSFNTKDTYPEQNLDNDLAQGWWPVTPFSSEASAPQDLDTAGNIGIGDPVAQTHKVMQNIRQLVEECGAKMEHVTKLIVYLVDVRHREADPFRPFGHVRRTTALPVLHCDTAPPVK